MRSKVGHLPRDGVSARVSAPTLLGSNARAGLGQHAPGILVAQGRRMHGPILLERRAIRHGLEGQPFVF